ncbi:MAG: HAD hydrolase-like protein, partial [Microcystaceae cyanobacterium]
MVDNLFTQYLNKTMLKAIIFDMDGLLIDSEPLWQEAEIEIFSQINILLTRELCLETTGLRVDEVVEYWYRRTPGVKFTKKEVEESIINRVNELICLKGKPKQGVSYILNFFQAKNVKLALATSSSYAIINVVLEKLGLLNVFQEICSATEEEY